MAAKIYTSRDAAREREADFANRIHRIAVSEARTKVRRWERKVARYGGAVHVETLERMRAKLAALVGEP